MKIPTKILDFITYLTGHDTDSIIDMFIAWQGKYRTPSQNNALHLYFDMLSKQFNNIGCEYPDYDFFTGKVIWTPFTPEIVKNIWKKEQEKAFGIKSTTKLTHERIDFLIDVFSKHFGEMGIELVEFPNWQTFLNKIDKKNGLD